MCPNIPSNLWYICCGSALLNGLSLRQYQVLAGVAVYLVPPPHTSPGQLVPRGGGGKITRGILPPTRGSFWCSGVGGKLIRPGIFTPCGGGGGGKLPRVRGIPRGIFTLEGRHCTKAVSLPVWGGGGASYPGFKINRYTGSVYYLYTF